MTHQELAEHLKKTRKPIDIRKREHTDEMRETENAEEVMQLNRIDMLKLMQTYGFTIRKIDFDNWRPTVRDSGSISGVWNKVEIIATDGLLGYFINGDDLIVGHIQTFDGKVKPLHSVTKTNGSTKPKKPRKKSMRQQLLEAL